MVCICSGCVGNNEIVGLLVCMKVLMFGIWLIMVLVFGVFNDICCSFSFVCFSLCCVMLICVLVMLILVCIVVNCCFVVLVCWFEDIFLLVFVDRWVVLCFSLCSCVWLFFRWLLVKVRLVVVIVIFCCSRVLFSDSNSCFFFIVVFFFIGVVVIELFIGGVSVIRLFLMLMMFCVMVILLVVVVFVLFEGVDVMVGVFLE